MAEQIPIDKLRTLYDYVQTRPRPEDVAETVLEVLGPMLAKQHRTVLDKAARNSMKRTAWGYSSMASDFARATTKVENQVKTATVLFSVEPISATDCLIPERIEAFVRKISEPLHKEYGKSKSTDRLNREQRQKVGMFKVQRWYNKRWRLLCSMEEKISRLVWNQRKYEYTRIGKSAMATQIPFEDFAADVGTACLVAYLAARMSVRSVFTNKSQEHAFDEVSAALLAHCKETGTARWDVIAYVMPDEPILARLTDEQRGIMLGRSWSLLVEMAEMLDTVWKKSKFDLKNMVVTSGNDSSTWNQVAGGWNKAREHWISLVNAMEMRGMLDQVCPGKVMRLMAADVVRWHLSSGGEIHPDTKVWAELPTPWDVIHGKAVCTRTTIAAACAKHAVDPAKWINGKIDREPVPFKPTPELVHGVSISSPSLALALRKVGAFSGKGIKGEVPEGFAVMRDENGFALRAEGRGV